VRVLALAIVAMLAAVPAVAQNPGWIGMTVEDQKDGGAVILRVEPNGPAGRAGLKEGDVILQFNKERVIGAQQLTRLVRETPVGRTVDVQVRRGSRDEIFKLTTERDSNPVSRTPWPVAPWPGGPRGPWPGGSEFRVPDRFPGEVFRRLPRMEMNMAYVEAGIHVEQTTDQLREYFGVRNGTLVRSVDSGTAAAKAGLKAGDVITAVDGKTIETIEDFSTALRAASRPTLKVVRDKTEREIRLE
jgi:serine protease Do